ncbi:hypothetical protein GE061_002790 [Apolygus lucorum]|uniref:Uncharacterized protein n=1 Tax=Apolygus lucorum TaxID=248454 RepID=A0A8S9X7G5_APOLU|nr:hypothetical protein GE061_002790 [Apolygus lucorum]
MELAGAHSPQGARRCSRAACTQLESARKAQEGTAVYNLAQKRGSGGSDNWEVLGSVEEPGSEQSSLAILCRCPLL